MSRYAIDVSDKAEQDIREAFAFISVENVAAAVRKSRNSRKKAQKAQKGVFFLRLLCLFVAI